MAGYVHSGQRQLFTMRDAVFHCIHTRLSHLSERPDPQSHIVETPLGSLVCILRAPVTLYDKYKLVKQLVWTAIPPRQAVDGDFVLYINESNVLVPRTLTEMEFNHLLPYHLELLLAFSLGQDQRAFVKILSGDKQAFELEYSRLEKMYSLTGIYKDLIAVPELV